MLVTYSAECAKDNNIVFIGSRQFSKVLMIPLELYMDELSIKLNSHFAGKVVRKDLIFN